MAVIRWYFGKYRRDFVFLTILSLVSAITNAAVPFLAGRLVDSIVGPENTFFWGIMAVPTVFIVLVLWFVVKIIADLTDKQIVFYSDRLDSLIEADYITRGIGKILDLPLSFHKEHKTGFVFDRIDRASRWLSQIISRILIELAPQFLSILVALGITFAINPALTIILILAVLFYILILFRITPRLAPLQRKTWDAYNRAYGNAYDTLVNIQTVKQAAGEEFEKRKHYRGFVGLATGLWVKLMGYWQNLSFYQRLLVTFVQFVIFALSIFFIRSGSMTIGELVMFNGYAAMLFGPFVVLGRNWQTLQSGLTGIEKAEQMLRVQPEAYEPKNGVILQDIKGRVELNKVSFRYQKTGRMVLDDVSFKVDPGMTVALVGESGVGKTTLIDLISFYYRPTRGTIFIDGHDIKKLNLKILRSQIGVVPQEIVLFNDTIKNNIKYGRFTAKEEEIFKAARFAYADEFIESFPRKYNQLVGERGVKLSTGQKQRIAIARTILRNPRILILDEPTSALDAKSERFIQEALSQLMKNRTTFIIAHRLSTVRAADIILVLEKGCIVEQGTHEKLLKIKDGVYRRLYELQVGLKTD